MVSKKRRRCEICQHLKEEKFNWVCSRYPCRRFQSGKNGRVRAVYLDQEGKCYDHAEQCI